MLGGRSLNEAALTGLWVGVWRSCLIQLPMMPRGFRLKVGPGATEALRMNANADMLGQMAFDGQIIRTLQMHVGHLSRLGRSLMSMSGNAIRIADLLTLVDKAAEQGRPATRDELRATVHIGLGRIVALYHRPSTSHQIC